MKTTSRISIVMMTCCAFGCLMDHSEHLEMGLVKSFKNLHLYPIHANSSFLDRRKKTGPFLTLREAIESKKVLISEHRHDNAADNQETSAAEVNTLFIENNSSDTVLILNGEVVEGGNQDRMIAQDVILNPHCGKLNLAVFCVEQDRWTGSGDEFSTTEQSLPPSSVRAVLAEAFDQEQIWESIKVNLDVNSVNSETGTIEDLNENEAYQRHLKTYTEALQTAFLNENGIVGLIAVSGNDILGTDLFATPELFQKHYPNLLQSYAAEAMAAGNITVNSRELGSYWRRLMETLKGEAGFLNTSANRKMMPKHFSTHQF